eukprot:m.91491 g.91491  ORF g.91491 m.91491 type:complete len:176 (+) comp9907_c0_seq1:85-612(+)
MASRLLPALRELFDSPEAGRKAVQTNLNRQWHLRQLAVSVLWAGFVYAMVSRIKPRETGEGTAAPRVSTAPMAATTAARPATMNIENGDVPTDEPTGASGISTRAGTESETAVMWTALLATLNERLHELDARVRRIEQSGVVTTPSVVRNRSVIAVCFTDVLVACSVSVVIEIMW